MEQNVLERILEGSMKPIILPIETLRKITNEFSEDRIIGEGGFATVYKGVVGNKNVAVKRIKSSMTIYEKLFRREVDSQMDVNHENVVRFLGLCSNTIETPMKNLESRGYIYAEIRERLLCFEYVGNGSLDKYITDELRGLEWDTRYEIIKGICTGLHYLHMEKRILHMDLKPANILLDNQMVPKITDFGLSRPVENPQTMTKNHFSTPGYSAPENLFGRGTMSVKSDMYSLGAIIIELVTGCKGIPNNNSNILRRWRHRWNKSGKETPLEYHQQVTECIEIGSLCLNSDPYTRPSISQIMSKFVEMERTKVSPLYWEDDMLGVEPLELQFRYDKKKQILSCPVELNNNTDGFIAFKIQTTSLVPYSIEPNMDIVKPRSRCSVDITLPTANTQDHRAALQYSTSNKQYTEDFIVRSIKVNEDLAAKDINQDTFDKHTSGQHVDEIHLVVVSESPTTKDIDEEPIIAVSNSGTKPTPIEPGSVQLVIKNNNKAPLLENNTKVMLELTGGDYTSDRPGLDLVAVLDVGVRLQGWMMDEMKTAMRFVVRKLSPIDCLSVVTFSYATTKPCPLRQITETSRQELLELIDGIKVSVRATNIKDELLTGLKVLADRKVSAGCVAAIILMSSYQESKGKASEVSVHNVPVYTFGLGSGNGSPVLSAVAANSIGGTFSHIQNRDVYSGGGLTKALSQCLAGLLTVSVQDLELTVASVRDESRIVKVTAGSYPQKEDHKGVVTVMLGNLYSREVRKVIVDLRLPAIKSGRSANILKVTCSYSSCSSGRWQQFVAPPETLTVWRTGVDVLEEEKPVDLQREEARLQTAKMIKEAGIMAGNCDLKRANGKLEEAHNMQSDPLVRTELQDLLKLTDPQDRAARSYLQVRTYALSSESSHDRQRFAGRGDMEIVRIFATPRMDMYLEQAKRFLRHPERPLPSSEEDEKVLGDLTICIASREEEMRTLSLSRED